MPYTWRSENNVRKSVLSCYHVGPKDQTQVLGFVSLCSSQLLVCVVTGDKKKKNSLIGQKNLLFIIRNQVKVIYLILINTKL